MWIDEIWIKLSTWSRTEHFHSFANFGKVHFDSLHIRNRTQRACDRGARQGLHLRCIREFPPNR